MSDTITDVSKIEGARFFAYYAVFPHIADNTFNSEKAGLDATNVQGTSNFEFQCRQWTSDANIARAAGLALPPKPVSKNSRLEVRQDLPNNGGTWIAQTDGPVFGVCPDLPAPLVPTPPQMTGLVPVGTPVQPTQDQKLDSIAVMLGQIITALTKAGVM